MAVCHDQEADLFLGNAGTAIRPLTAALAALGGGDFLLHGVKRMHERPIGDLVDALNDAGAEIEYTENQGYPPIRIHAGNIDRHDLHVKGNVSSQFLTALLMAAPLMARSHDVTIHVIGELISKPYIEITLNLMRSFGVEIEQDGWKSFTLRKGQFIAVRCCPCGRGCVFCFLFPCCLLPLPVALCGLKVSENTVSRAISVLQTFSKKWEQMSFMVTITLKSHIAVH